MILCLILYLFPKADYVRSSEQHMKHDIKKGAVRTQKRGPLSHPEVLGKDREKNG